MSSMSACPACIAGPKADDVEAYSHKPNVHLSVPTIHCAACIGTVERALMAMPEVSYARVNLSLKRVAIEAHGGTVDALVKTLDAAGFEAHPLDATVLGDVENKEERSLLIRLSVAGFAMMNVMLLSVAIWSGADGATRELFHLISAAISLPAVLYAGQPFFRSAQRALVRGTMNMDVPISLAILLASAMSLYETLNGGRHAYFDAALSLTFFLLVGRYLDQRTRSAARSAAKELSALEVRTAQKLVNGKVVETSVDDLVIGDLMLIPTGVRVPVDGQLMTARARTDRSFLTGETASVELAQGAQVQAGEINLGAPFQITATAVGEDTTLRRLSTLVETAETSRNRYTNLADRAARIYAPAVHLLAFVAFAVWYWISGDLRLSINIAVAVLIITCPCALGLAVPAVATAAIGKLYAKGFLVKNGTALERIAEVDRVVFDKTGTLTLPKTSVSLNKLSAHETPYVLALAQASSHPLSRAIARALRDVTPVELQNVQEIPGAGVQGEFDGSVVRLGRGSFIGADFTGTGFRFGDDVAREIPMVETIRPGVEIALEGLSEQGLGVMILSGDRDAAVAPLANRLGITMALPGVTAEEKHAAMQQMEKDGHHVLMVGDGLNDTASLAAAHASIAPSSALDASRNAADIICLRESFEDLPLVLKVARAATRLSKQNFAIAACYNLIAVPVALLGFATPLIAAIAMSASSITVLLNALRVGRVS